jgi:enterochelin esterase-like enzyme
MRFLRPLLLSLFATVIVAQEKPADASPDRARANFARPITLAADDIRRFPEPPAEYRELPRTGLRGRLEVFEYDSAVTGTRRKAQVYLPPGYSPDKRYPVLYLLHGIGGNEYEWTSYVKAHAIIDNLIATGRAAPMIVVFPNGRAMADDRPPRESVQSGKRQSLCSVRERSPRKPDPFGTGQIPNAQ